MADQSFIEKKVIELSKKLGIAQKDIIEGLMLLIEGKPLTDQIQILNDVNMEDLIKAKTSKVISGYTGANAGLLLGKIKFSPIQEKDLLALITQSEKYLTGEIVAIELARKVPARNSNGVIEEMNVIQYKILIDNFLPRKMYLMTTASFVKKINE